MPRAGRGFVYKGRSRFNFEECKGRGGGENALFFSERCSQKALKITLWKSPDCKSARFNLTISEYALPILRDFK